MAIEISSFRINRWNSDDQALAELSDAHFSCFMGEPTYSNKRSKVRSKKHIAWTNALGTIERAAEHIVTQSPEPSAAIPQKPRF
jgi:hypothetical protein